MFGIPIIELVTGVGSFALSAWVQIQQQKQADQARKDSAQLGFDKLEANVRQQAAKRGATWVRETISLIVVISMFPLPILLVTLFPDLQIVTAYLGLHPGGLFGDDTEMWKFLVTENAIVFSPVHTTFLYMIGGFYLGGLVGRRPRY